MGAGVALIVGAALYGLAFPPRDWAILGWFALVPLLLTVRGRSARWAFGFGVLYGYACAAAVSGWLIQAIARFFGLALPVAFSLASIYALVFWGTAFGLFAAGTAVLQRRESSARQRAAIPALWVATELLRGRVLGQPWGLLGYTQHAELGLIQIATVTGVYGVSFLLAFGNVEIAEALLHLRARRLGFAVAALSLPIALVLPLWSVGALVGARGPIGGYAGRSVAVVQTNVEPAQEWSRAYTDHQLLAHVAATEAVPLSARTGLIVWPEYAVPRYLESEPMLAVELAGLAVRRHADLVFGVPRSEGDRAYNSVRLITASGRNGGSYDKQRLVLMAEANPFASPLPDGASDGPLRFTRGDEAGVLQGFVPLGVSICHEILFPELIARAVSRGAALLVNVSNDGWIDAGYGVASRQHFAMSAFRAVETRRYLVRAATTGVSGVIDPYGRVVDALPPHTAGTLTANVAGRTTITPYVWMGDAFAVACVLLAGLALFGGRILAVQRHPGFATAARAR
jgi:apolipoprotein N-acyltransferase